MQRHSGNPVESKSLPDLYEPAIVGFAPNAFVLRGYERLETAEGTIGAAKSAQLEITNCDFKVFELPRVQLKHEVGGKPLDVSLDRLHERLGFDFIESPLKRRMFGTV